MRCPLSASLLLLAAGAGCSSSAAPLPRERPPRQLRVMFGGFGVGSTTVELAGDTLVVTRRAWAPPPNGTESRVVPDAGDWRAFWAATHAAGVGAWPRECVDRRIADGAGLSVRLVVDGRTVESAASNSWPQANGRCSTGPDMSAEVRAFLDAVGALVGQPYP